MSSPAKNLPMIGTLVAAVPKNVEFHASVIAAELANFADQADKALHVAQTAVVNDEESFGRAADVIGAINGQLSKIEDARKAKTSPLDAAKSVFMTLYGASKDRLSAAKTTLSGKADQWRREEQARLRVKAEAEAKAAREEAEKLAAAQKALGDAEGAKQIIEEAAAVSTAPVKVQVTGAYGSSAGTRTRKVGEVTDKAKFLNAVLKRAEREPELAAVLISVSILQSPLNALAAAILAGEVKPVPGFKAEEVESLNVRR